MLLQPTSRACCRAGIHCSSCPEPLMIKDIKVQVNKQKLNNVRPAQMKHNSDKMTIAPMSSQPCSKPNVSGCFTHPMKHISPKSAEKFIRSYEPLHYFFVVSFVLCSSCFFSATNHEARNPVNVPNSPTPVVIRNAAMIRPSVVTGYLSPYPTVVIVT